MNKVKNKKSKSNDDVRTNVSQTKGKIIDTETVDSVSRLIDSVTSLIESVKPFISGKTGEKNTK
jgi:hypothetical protein